MKRFKLPLLGLVAALTIAFAASAFTTTKNAENDEATTTYWELRSPELDPLDPESYKPAVGSPMCSGVEAICVIQAPQQSTEELPDIEEVDHLVSDIEAFLADGTTSNVSNAIQYKN